MLAGGARDTRRFRAAVQGRSLGALPPPSSLTCQGVFNQHSFPAGLPEDAADISLAAHWGWAEANSPSLAAAQASAAASGAQPPTEELWLGCFLRSRLDGRPRDSTPLDLVLVLDTSGSMNCSVEFSRNARIRVPQPPAIGAAGQLTRLSLAKEAVHLVVPCLREDDRLSVATFTDFGQVLQTLEPVGRLDLGALFGAVDGLMPLGGTTLSAGMAAALQAAGPTPPAEAAGGRRHRRVVFLTDMEDARGEELEAMVVEQAKLGLYVSFVGIGIDFNSCVAEQVTKHPGANYFCITGQDEVKKVMVEDFDRNFFPCALGVKVSFQSDIFDVAAVYGTPVEAKKEVMPVDWHPSLHRLYPLDFKMQARALLLCWRRCMGSRLPVSVAQRVLNCLAPASRSALRLGAVFPCSMLEDGAVEGGLILVQMMPCKDAGDVSFGHVRLALDYTAMDGRPVSTYQDHRIPLQASGSLSPAPSLALRKGLLLRRFVEVCRRYLGASFSPHASAEKLRQVLGELEAFLSTFDDTLDICPGIRQELEGFCRLAHNHCDEWMWMGR